MPKQRRTLGKKSKQIGSKGNIKIAKPEMTMTGFEHTASNLALKKKLDTGSIRPEFQDIVSSAKFITSDLASLPTSLAPRTTDANKILAVQAIEMIENLALAMGPHTNARRAKPNKGKTSYRGYNVVLGSRRAAAMRTLQRCGNTGPWSWLDLVVWGSAVRGILNQPCQPHGRSLGR